MRRFGVLLIVILLTLSSGSLWQAQGAIGQSDDSGLQTAVADMQTRVAALETQVAQPVGTPLPAETAGLATSLWGNGTAVAGPPSESASAPNIVTIDAYDIGWRYNGQKTNPSESMVVPVTPGATIVLHNTGESPHNFSIDRLGIGINMAPGQTVQVTLPSDIIPGDYEFYCDVPGHRQAGMVGTLRMRPGMTAAPAPARGGAGASSTPPPAQTQPVAIAAYDLGWQYNGEKTGVGKPVTVPVAPGQTISLANEGASPHNFSIDRLGISVDLPPGQTEQVTIPADTAPGDYEFYCVIPGHREAGMVGTLTVQTGAGQGAMVENPPQSATRRSVSANGWDISFRRVEASGGFPGVLEPVQRPRGIYALVHLTVTFTGNVPTAFPFNDLTLTDTAGRTFSLDQRATADWLIENTDLIPSAELQPGLPYDVVAIFDVPPDVTRLTLTDQERTFAIDLDS